MCSTNIYTFSRISIFSLNSPCLVWFGLVWFYWFLINYRLRTVYIEFYSTLQSKTNCKQILRFVRVYRNLIWNNWKCFCGWGGGVSLNYLVAFFMVSYQGLYLVSHYFNWTERVSKKIYIVYKNFRNQNNIKHPS